MCKKKSDPKAALSESGQELLLALSRSLLCRLHRSLFLLLLGNVELGGDHDDVVVFHAFVIGPFLGFEVALQDVGFALKQSHVSDQLVKGLKSRASECRAKLA